MISMPMGDTLALRVVGTRVSLLWKPSEELTISGFCADAPYCGATGTGTGK